MTGLGFYLVRQIITRAVAVPTEGRAWSVLLLVWLIISAWGLPWYGGPGGFPTDACAEESAPGRARPGQESAVEARGNLVLYEGGIFTAEVSDMSLRALLMELGRQVHAKVVIEGLDDRTVSDRFVGLPLEEALRRLLPRESFTLTYAEDRDPGGRVRGTRLKALHVYGSGRSVSTSDQPLAASDRSQAKASTSESGDGASLMAAGGPLMERLSSFLERNGEIGLEEGSELAKALNAEHASPTGLMAAAMNHDDPGVRGEAARVLAGVIDGDPDSRALAGEGGLLGDDAVVAALRKSGGTNSEEFVRNMGRYLENPVASPEGEPDCGEASRFSIIPGGLSAEWRLGLLEREDSRIFLDLRGSGGRPPAIHVSLEYEPGGHFVYDTLAFLAAEVRFSQ